MNNSHLLLVLLVMIFGAVNTIMLTLQNHQNVGQGKKYFHPFVQAAVALLGQSLCIVVYIIYRCVKSQKNYLEQPEFMKQKCPWYLPLIPGVFDALSTLLAYVALNLTPASVWQISRGGVIVTTAFFSFLCLKKKLTRSSLIGCILAFLGITIVQIFQITLSTQKSNSSNHTINEQLIGVLFLLISLFFNTGALIVQKMIFNKYTINPLKMVFIQGVFGFIVMALLAIILSIFPCPNISSIQSQCKYNEYNGINHIDSIQVFFDQLSNNHVLLFFNIGLLISMSISVPLAVTISKVINPVSRALADVCRTVLIWGFCLYLTLSIGQNNNQYKLQQTSALLNSLKMIGFILLVIGTLIYHDVIKILKEKQPQDRISLLSKAQHDDDFQQSAVHSVHSNITWATEDGKKQKQKQLLV